MSNLKALPWKDLSQGEVRCVRADSPIYDYAIVNDGKAFKVGYYNPQSPIKYATGFATIDDAKTWCWNHYNEKMQPYVVPTTLKDAVQMIIDACHGASVKGGWWHDVETGEPLKRNKGEMLMLIVSEVAEAMEGDRKGLMDDHLPEHTMETVEIADVFIRVGDYAGGHKLDVAQALVDKLTYNANRADHKIENRAKDGGKKY